MTLRRSLLYAAVIRAEKNLVMVGEKKAYLVALHTPGNDRKADLASKIRYELGLKGVVEHDSSKNIKQEQAQTEVKEEVAEPKDYILIPDLVYSGKINPVIGIERIELETRD